MYAVADLLGTMMPQYNASAAEGDLFAKHINDFAKKIREIGPNPIRLE